MGKKVFDQRALTRLKTRSGAGAHRDRRSRRRGKKAEERKRLLEEAAPKYGAQVEEDGK